MATALLPYQTANSLLQVDSFGNLPIHLCCLSGSVAILEKILSKLTVLGTKAIQKEKRKLENAINLKSSSGQTPLMIAAENGFDDIVELLIEFGAEIYRRMKTRKWTALHFAAKEGFLNVAKVLVKDANKDFLLTQGRFGETAEDLAAEHNKIDVSLWLKKQRKEKNIIDLLRS
eukprot:snap_masked-scaffold_5-processed-gene-5.39-mRNA-1 protein AED:0.24 eAED:0.24 QI:0/-1/0/1/-1/1/1/0/173